MKKFKEKQEYDSYNPHDLGDQILQHKDGGRLSRTTLIYEQLAEAIDRALATMGRFDTLTITIKVESNEVT